MMNFFLRVHRTGELIRMELDLPSLSWSSPKGALDRNEIVSVVGVSGSVSKDMGITKIMVKGDILTIPLELLKPG